MRTPQWFEKNEQYTDASALAEGLHEETLALVRVYADDSKSQSGWGRKAFARNYGRGRFAPKRALRPFEEHGTPFGVLMRSLPMVCVDIDGKNGGIQASSMLRLPPTLAERSKSGNGYHLFYRVLDAWHEEFGFDMYPDFNGLLPGVDIRATGIVYHHEHQRWNSEEVADAPEALIRLMQQRVRSNEAERARRASPLSGDDLAIAQERTLVRLAKPIKAGMRNQTLFGIGCDLQLYNVQDWENVLMGRAIQLGLDDSEAAEVVRHVKKYA